MKSFLRDYLLPFLAGFLLILAVSQLRADEITPSLAVSGTGTVSAAPDEGYFTVTVSTVNPEAGKALTENNAKVNKLYHELDHSEVKHEVQTTEFSLTENFKQVENGKDQQGSPTYKLVRDGYVATNTLRVTVCELGKFGDVLDRLVAAGATHLGQITFGNSKQDELLKQARAAAVKSANEKANTIAEGLGVRVGLPFQVSEHTGTTRPMYQSMRSEAAESGSTISGGALSYSVTVTVTFGIRGTAGI